MPVGPSLLAFDTSTEAMAVAACGPAGDAAWAGPGGAAASARLLPRALAGLAQTGAALADVDAIAFGAGPGAFTGLRTACAVAQGLGFGLGRPLLAIDSLMQVAEAARGGALDRDAHLWVAMDARMDEVYAAAYRLDEAGAGWEVVVAPALYTLPALRARWADAPPGQVAGSAPGVFGDRLPLAGARLLRAAGGGEPGAGVDRAEALLRLARRAWAAGLHLDPADARPVYLRDKVALTTAERAERAAAAGAAGGTGDAGAEHAGRAGQQPAGARAAA